MLHLITSSDDSLIDYIRDDPVRPEISKEFRVDRNRFIAALLHENIPESMVCISLHDFIPSAVKDLDNTDDDPTIAIFYTIWSYKPGSGAKLLQQSVQKIKQLYPNITQFLTLSPKTQMARKFHLRNGAVTFREMLDTINYEYSNL